MHLRWIGALLVVCGCGWVGFQMAIRCRQEEISLRKLHRILVYMECEIQYSLLPLPDLCENAGKLAGGTLKKILHELTLQMEQQVLPDARSCMRAVLDRYPDLHQSIRRIMLQMGQTFGEFDMPGQIRELQALQQMCQKEGERLSQDRDERIRSYQTLGLCTGLALAIILI